MNGIFQYFMFVVFVKCLQRRANHIVLTQESGSAGIFRQNQLH